MMVCSILVYCARPDRPGISPPCAGNVSVVVVGGVVVVVVLVVVVVVVVVVSYLSI
jgi:hypothetical protein